MKSSYENRYGDVFTFTLDSDNNILWEGNFQYVRFGMPNDYSAAYEAYLHDREGIDEDHLLSLEEFKVDVHEYQGNQHLYPEYVKLVKSITNAISMIDPSGGPYISRGMSLTHLGFKDYVVDNFERIENGYKIITKKCNFCGSSTYNHKMSCKSQKCTVHISD